MKQTKSYSVQIFIQDEPEPISLSIFKASTPDLAKRIARGILSSFGELHTAKLFDLGSSSVKDIQGELIMTM